MKFRPQTLDILRPPVILCTPYDSPSRGCARNILELCDEVPAAVALTASARDAIQTMLDHRVGAVAVVDENHLVAGIFTERDVLQ